jgi:hypothetical protein
VTPHSLSIQAPTSRVVRGKQLVAGFWRRTNLAVCRLGPEIYRDAT